MKGIRSIILAAGALCALSACASTDGGSALSGVEWKAADTGRLQASEAGAYALKVKETRTGAGGRHEERGEVVGADGKAVGRYRYEDKAFHHGPPASYIQPMSRAFQDRATAVAADLGTLADRTWDGWRRADVDGYDRAALETVANGGKTCIAATGWRGGFAPTAQANEVFGIRVLSVVNCADGEADKADREAKAIDLMRRYTPR